MPFRNRSLRVRLTLWFVLVFAVVIGGVLLGAWVLHRRSTQQFIDENLIQVAQGVAERLQEANGVLNPEGLRIYQPIDRTFAILAVRDESGDVVALRPNVDDTALPPLPSGHRANTAVTRHLDETQSQQLLGVPIDTRMVTYRLIMPGGTMLYIDVARTVSVDPAFRSFWLNVAAIGVMVALPVSILAAWFVAGRAVQHLRQLVEAANTVSPERISSRIEVESQDVEVERLETALNDALARLEEGYLAQERFISNVAHDLKTPIAVMLTESQVLRPGSVTLEEFEEYRKRVMAEMQRLGGLVESFLTLARANQGEALTRVLTISIVDVIIEAVTECDPEAEQMQIRLVPKIEESESTDGFELRGDSDLLRSMLVNLIRNAIRYSPTGEAVDICAQQTNGRIEVSVRDRGPGVPEELREKIFSRFTRAPAFESRASGTGLGLAIAKSVAEIHHGTIGVQNCEDVGCVFTVVLPVQGLEADARQAIPPAAPETAEACCDPEERSGGDSRAT